MKAVIKTAASARPSGRVQKSRRYRTESAEREFRNPSCHWHSSSSSSISHFTSLPTSCFCKLPFRPTLPSPAHRLDILSLLTSSHITSISAWRLWVTPRRTTHVVSLIQIVNLLLVAYGYIPGVLSVAATGCALHTPKVRPFFGFLYGSPSLPHFKHGASTTVVSSLPAEDL